MSAHASLSPSSAHRWLACPGSVALSRDCPRSSSIHSREGTAAHTLADRALRHGKDADFFLNEMIEVEGQIFVVDEDMAMYVQIYLNEVRALAKGGTLLTEQRLDLSSVLGPNQFGTADAVILKDGELIVIDLKYGRGERVDIGTAKAPNPQLALYGLGAYHAMLLLEDIHTIHLVVIQPRIDNICNVYLGCHELMDFAHTVKECVADISVHPNSLYPGDKQCRWCPAKAFCPALAEQVQAEVANDFEAVAQNTDQALSAHARMLDLVETWLKAVRDEVNRRVMEGGAIIGADGKPMKVVEGRPGNRSWIDAGTAEAALVGQLADKAYAPHTLITPSVADKLLNKRGGKEMWKDVFEPIINRPAGRPIVVQGSDPRPAFSGAADVQDFEGGLE